MAGGTAKRTRNIAAIRVLLLLSMTQEALPEKKEWGEREEPLLHT